MSGALPPLAELNAVCKRHNAVLYVDDAHGTGVLGQQGPRHRAATLWAATTIRWWSARCPRAFPASAASSAARANSRDCSRSAPTPSSSAARSRRPTSKRFARSATFSTPANTNRSCGRLQRQPAAADATASMTWAWSCSAARRRSSPCWSATRTSRSSRPVPVRAGILRAVGDVPGRAVSRRRAAHPGERQPFAGVHRGTHSGIRGARSRASPCRPPRRSAHCKVPRKVWAARSASHPTLRSSPPGLPRRNDDWPASSASPPRLPSPPGLPRRNDDWPASKRVAAALPVSAGLAPAERRLAG